MSKLLLLRQALGTAVDELSEFAGKKEFAAKEAAIVQMEAEIRDLEKAQARSASLARPTSRGGHQDGGAEEVNPHQRTLPEIRSMDARKDLGGFDGYLSLARKGLEFTPRADTHFRSVGEQLQAIVRYSASKGSDVDSRLVRAPTGASEVDGSGGGFLVQVDFATAIFMRAYDTGSFMSRVNRIPISANSNGLKIPGVDETSRVSGSRYGGVSTSWVGEGTTVTPSRPKFRLVEFDLKKMMSLAYMTDELISDALPLTSIYSTAFSEEITITTENAIFEGTGAGTPLGIMNSPAKVAVAKEAGQATKTIVKENIDNMWSRMWAPSMRNAVWFINQDALPQLMQMNQAVGTGGQLVYLPAGGLSATPYSTLYGREVVWTEQANTLGTEGDIMLADLSQYTLVDKNGVQAATSMHVAFNTDEMVFRITYRVDGKPMWHQPLTPQKGSNTRSPFITLATR